ncbi:MAG: GNAT family N-acetyltransferase [Candidatus Omnitrophica bacterium]|nr:GNAT family N-acetyltransferase [Candidatus Omnitrophota bacterium]
MDKQITIRQSGADELVLRSISGQDCERLRKWKNANKSAFFYDKHITSEDQNKWYLGYLRDPQNYMFILEHSSAPIGCIGFKLVCEGADIYNVIMGDLNYRRKGILSIGLNMLCSYIKKSHTEKIFLKVLDKNTTAHRFYLKNGFIITGKKEDHLVMEMRRSVILPIEISE